MFYQRNSDGVPGKWMSMVRHTLATLGPRVQSSRMVREYVDHYYAPAARSVAALAEDEYRGAKELAEYRERLHSAWVSVCVDNTEMVVDNGQTPLLGGQVTVRAEVDLAGLAESDVDVEVVVGRVDDSDQLHDFITRSMSPAGHGRYEASVTLPHTGPAGYTVRVLPKHPLLSGHAELGKVVLAE